MDALTCCSVLNIFFSEQEHRRTQESSDIDDRTQHEIYSHPFLRSVMAGVASMMCSYSMLLLLSFRPQTQLPQIC